MPIETFRGDPYKALDVRADASSLAIKRRWRELAREHHPDRAVGPEQAAESTRRMARINAAYDLLSDPERRRRYDAAHGHPGPVDEGGARGHAPEPPGPPPPRPTTPVTARFDTTPLYHRRNATLSTERPPLVGHRPISFRERVREAGDLRASQPNGPVRLHRTGRREPPPTLEQSLATELEFGRFRGHTLGEVAGFEPTYIDWIARTISRDRDLVVKARVVQADLDARGVARRVRPPTPGFGERRERDAAG